jgi:type I restriction enzyme S subunit
LEERIAENIEGMTGATGRQRVDEACFDKFVFACPDPQTITAFPDLMPPMFRNINVLAEKNANLRRTCDLSKRIAARPRWVGCHAVT